VIKYLPIKKAPLKQPLNKLKEAHKQQNLEGIDASTKELNDAWMAASSEMYSASQQPGETPGAEQQAGAQQGGPSENVTDAEFEEVK
jgi:molecular chaperone DnaK